MAMSQIDKFKLMGVIKKTRIESFSDLNIDSKSRNSIYDFLDATIDITMKFVRDNQNEKSVLNSMSAIEVVLIQMYNLYQEVDEERYTRIM